MTRFQEFWSGVVRKTPGFGNPDKTVVKLTIANVRKLVGQAHRDGFRHGMDTSKSLEGLGKTSDSYADIMETLRKIGEGDE